MSHVGLSLPRRNKLRSNSLCRDPLRAHARDELGITGALSARTVHAALASAGSFTFGAVLPLAVTESAPTPFLIPWVSDASLFFLAALGTVAARAGDAGKLVGAWRVTF